MRYSSRFFLYAPVGAFVAIAAAVGLLWWHSANAFEQQLAALKGREAVPGVTLDWSEVEIGGFPFRVDAVFQNFTAHGAGPHGPFRWDSPQVALHRLTYRADRLVFEAAGTQRLSWVDAGARAHSISFQQGALHASALLDSQGLARFDLDIAQFLAPAFSAARVQFHLRRNGADGVDMVAAAEHAKGALGPFGGAVRGLRLYLTLPRANAHVAVLKGEASPAAAHTRWHDQGGAATVTRTELNGADNGMTPEQGGVIVALLEALF